MNLASKVQSALTNPAMFHAYLRWFATKLVSGKPPRLDLPESASIGEWISFSEYWSFQDIIPEPERLFVVNCLAAKTNGLAFDIGANIGAFTCMIASMGHSVHSFEPIPETFCRFKNNVKHNRLLNRTNLNCLAVGKEQGLVTFRVEEDAPATNRMEIPGELSSHDTSSSQTVAAVSLDEYCATKGVEFIDFLKVDVEGMEPFVLKGAHNLFTQRKIAAVLIEICPGNLRAVGLTPAALFHEFECAHYTSFTLNDDGTPGARLSLHEIEAMSLANVVLLPES
jgi:FkbM family methyltransferase